MESRSDAELVAAAGRGDAAAFEALYRRHRDWVVRLAWRFTRDQHAALDVAQDTFSHLLRRAPTLHLTARLTTYLYPVVKNLSLTVLRRRIRRTQVESAAPAPGHDLPADTPDRAALARAMAALPDPQREVVLMRIVDEMSLEETATALGVPSGTVKSRLHHALAALRADHTLNRFFAP